MSLCRYNNIKIIISSRLFAFSTFQSSNKFRTNFIYLFYVICFSGVFVFLHLHLISTTLSCTHHLCEAERKNYLLNTHIGFILTCSLSLRVYRFNFTQRESERKYIASHTRAYHPTIYVENLRNDVRYSQFIKRNEISIIRRALLRKSRFLITQLSYFVRWMRKIVWKMILWGK